MGLPPDARATVLPARLRPGQMAMLIVPFLLNDLASIHVADWRWWLAIDYVAVKLVPLLCVLWLLRKGIVRARDIGIAAQSMPAFLCTAVAVTLICTVLDQSAYRWLAGLPGYAPLAPPMPAIGTPLWRWFDLSVGLLAVGVMEELVFRGCMLRFLSQYTRSGAAIVLLSGIVFGLIHWSAGLHAVIVTGLIGAVLMLAYLRTGSLPALMLAHALVDFIDFSGVIPRALFSI